MRSSRIYILFMISTVFLPRLSTDVECAAVAAAAADNFGRLGKFTVSHRVHGLVNNNNFLAMNASGITKTPASPIPTPASPSLPRCCPRMQRCCDCFGFLMRQLYVGWRKIIYQCQRMCCMHEKLCPDGGGAGGCFLQQPKLWWVCVRVYVCGSGGVVVCAEKLATLFHKWFWKLCTRINALVRFKPENFETILSIHNSENKKKKTIKTREHVTPQMKYPFLLVHMCAELCSS